MRRAALACVAVLGIALAGCGGGGGGKTARYDEKGVGFTFSYPKDLAEVPVDTAEIKGRAPLARVAIGQDQANAVIVAHYRLAKPVEQYDPNVFQTTLDRTVLALARFQKLKPGPRKAAKVAGIPGYTYDLTDGDGVEQRLAFAFQGRDQLFVRCLWDPDPEAQKTIQAACDEVVGSLRLR